MEEQPFPEVSEFERALLDAITVGEQPVSNALRNQLAAAAPSLRKLSGVGFFLYFEVPQEIAPIDPKNFETDILYFDAAGLLHGGLAVLFVRDGYVKFLEAWAQTGDWPESITEYQLRPLERNRDPLHSYKELLAWRESRRV